MPLRLFHGEDREAGFAVASIWRMFWLCRCVYSSVERMCCWWIAKKVGGEGGLFCEVGVVGVGGGDEADGRGCRKGESGMCLFICSF